ncbi:MAG: hypothetical protein OEU54_04175 [Gemmatimonadota bacterium]|nr:hypothetical protein [Gemmatimonadota bacterium]
MVKSRLAMLLLVMSPLLAACGASLTVEVTTEGAGGEATPVANLEVQFLPYDRDSLFSALASDAGTPEPQVPADVQARLDSVQALQATWRDAEATWNDAREQLRQLSDRLGSVDRRSSEYRQMFDQFNGMERQERAANQTRQSAFQAFTDLQSIAQTQLDSVRAVIESWEDVAFADFVDVEASLLQALGQEVHFDTTDVDGLITRSLGGGDWWIHARVAAPAGELYWNVLSGGVDTLRLNPGNAEQRLVF